MSLNHPELLRYVRHLSLPEIGLEGQELLKTSRVICVGAGGLGCAVLQYLAAAGIGHLGVIDGDVIDITNLQRQVLYADSDLGLKKVVVTKKQLERINPLIQISIYDEYLTQENALQRLAAYDIIVDCTDNYAARYLVSDACVALDKPNVFASVYQFEGMCTVFPGQKGPCYRCLYPEPPPSNLISNCSEGGVLGLLPGLLGMVQGIEVIKQLLKLGDSLVGRVLRVDTLSMTFQQFNSHQNKNCIVCAQHRLFDTLTRPVVACAHDDEKVKATQQFSVTAHDLKTMINNDSVFLVDVREPYEREIYHIGGYHMPLQTVTEVDNLRKMSGIDKPIVVYCKSGRRSQIAVDLLRAQGIKDVYHLAGGILAWNKASLDVIKG